MKRKHILYLFLVLTLQSCNSCKERRTGIKELGDNFGLVKDAVTKISICYRAYPELSYYTSFSVCITPFAVREYAYNDKWIIAKSIEQRKDTLYWIIDKKFVPNRYEIEKQLKQQTTGPLDSIGFYSELEKRSIKLELKKIH